MQLAILAHGGECFLFNGCRAQFDAAEHGGVEDVDTGVDSVTDEFNGFLDEAVDAAVVAGFVHYDTVFGGLFYFGHDDGAFVAVGFVEVGHLLEGVVADDVGVENEEWGVVFAENLFGELERTSGAERLGLDREFNLDVVLLLVLQVFVR